MAIQRHCPPSSASACFPAPTLAAIMISALLLTLLISLSVYHALKTRQAAPNDEEAQHSPTTTQVPSTASLPHRPSPTTATPLPSHSLAPTLPPPCSPRPSSHTLSVPLFYNANPQIPPATSSQASSTAQASSTLPAPSTSTLPPPYNPSTPAPQTQRPPRQLTHYLTDLEARFAPESRARTEAEVEGLFQGVETRKLPRPAMRGREVQVVRAWVLEGEGGRRGGWYVGGRG